MDYRTLQDLAGKGAFSQNFMLHNETDHVAVLNFRDVTAEPSEVGCSMWSTAPLLRCRLFVGAAYVRYCPPA